MANILRSFTVRNSRFFSTSSPSPSSLAYPYSKTAILPPPVPPVITPNTPSLEGLKTGKGLMHHLKCNLPVADKRKLMETLFSRTHPSRAKPGDVLQVTMEHSPTSFTGVLMGVRRKGMDTNFTLRNVMQRTGVELQVSVNSPHFKDVRVVSTPQKRSRRSKMYFLRDNPDKMNAIAGAVRKK